MNPFKVLFAALIPLAAVLSATSAPAAVLTYKFTGTVNNIGGAPLDIANGGVFALGQAVSGTFSYDDTAVDAAPGNPLYGEYNGASSGTFNFADVGAGAYTASWTGGHFVISDTHCCGGDHIGVGVTAPPSWGPSVNGYFSETATLGAYDFTQTSITGDTLSGFVIPPFSAFQFAAGTLQFGDGLGFSPSVNFSVESLDPVPAPGAFAVLALGLLGLGALRRRLK